MADKTYDAIVIGGGPGGYVCAIRLGQLKQKVLCVEKDEVGGVCLNWGCVPSKAIIATSHTFEKGKAGASYRPLIDNPRIGGGKVIGAKEAVSLRTIPPRLLVIGGGIIGMELGGAYQRLGSDLTVVEALPTLLTGVDADVAAVVEKTYVKRGAKILKGAKALG